MQKILIIIICLRLSVLLFSQTLVDGKEFYNLELNQLRAAEALSKKLPEGLEKDSKLAFIYHFLAEKGELTAELAVNYFEKIIQQNPHDLLIKAYLGSAYTLLGNEQKTKAKKLKYVNIGIALMDEAYNNDSDNYDVAILVAYNSIALPDQLFSRLKVANAIIEKLFLNFKDAPYDLQAELLYLKAVYLFAGADPLQAINIWEQIIRDYADTKIAEQAQQKLAELEK